MNDNNGEMLNIINENIRILHDDLTKLLTWVLCLLGGILAVLMYVASKYLG
jgi:hypothetical protein